MKRFGIIGICLVTLVFAAAMIAGCDSDSSTSDVKFYGVRYSLSMTGSSSVSSVTYDDGLGGKETVNNPPNGWTAEFPANPGDVIGATAVGQAVNGMITLEVEANPTSGGNAIVRTDSCSGSNLGCSLVIPDETLP